MRVRSVPLFKDLMNETHVPALNACLVFRLEKAAQSAVKKSLAPRTFSNSVIPSESRRQRLSSPVKPYHAALRALLAIPRMGNYCLVNTTGVPRPMLSVFDALPLFTAISR